MSSTTTAAEKAAADKLTAEKAAAEKAATAAAYKDAVDKAFTTKSPAEKAAEAEKTAAAKKADAPKKKQPTALETCQSNAKKTRRFWIAWVIGLSVFAFLCLVVAVYYWILSSQLAYQLASVMPAAAPVPALYPNGE
jgi:primosomal protein N'